MKGPTVHMTLSYYYFISGFKVWINERDAAEKTPLHLAMEMERYSIVEILLDANASMFYKVHDNNVGL